MVDSLQVTLLFTAIFIVLSIPMAIAVGLRRAKTGIMILHGDDDNLLRRIRAHANFIEYVPLALLGLAGAEISGAPYWLVLACGVVLLFARLIHYTSLVRTITGTGRAIGAVLTTSAMAVLAITILVNLGGFV